MFLAALGASLRLVSGIMATTYNFCLIALLATLGFLSPVHAADTPLQAAIARLTPDQQTKLKAYQKARIDHEKNVDRYWSKVESKRTARRKKQLRRLRITSADYVKEQPPEYAGPPRPDEIYAILPRPPKAPPDLRPGIAIVPDFLQQAAIVYGFKPDRVEEDEFMISYAVEALKLGLSKEQVIRVFALETGGMGTHDLQSGFNPKTKRAASTALGYAQLLAANSIEQLRKEGADYADRLDTQAASGSLPSEKAGRLRAKAAIIRRMRADAMKLPESWPAHVAYAKTAKGLAMHAINLDGDVGPWVQVTKLKSVKDYAARNGMASLTGGQLEMMNLAGPARGYEMMQPIGKDMATANFFDRGGYERNPVVLGKTGAQLLVRIDEIMDRNVQKPGAIRFAAIFDAISRRMRAANSKPTGSATSGGLSLFNAK